MKRDARRFRTLSGLLVMLFVVLGIGAQQARADWATVTVTGRFVYIDDSGAQVGIRHARVEMCNDNFFSCSPMGVSETDADGYFTVTGGGNDFFPGDRPDPVVSVIADSSAATVIYFESIAACFRSGTTSNPTHGSTINVGTISPNNGYVCFNDPMAVSFGLRNEPWQLHNNGREAWEFMQTYSPGLSVPKVQVVWPPPCGGIANVGCSSSYDNGTIYIVPLQTWNEAVFMKMYGEHVLAHFAEVPAAAAPTENCISMGQRDGQPLWYADYCLWRAEDGGFAWAEGFAAFFSHLVTTYYGKNDTFQSYAAQFGLSSGAPAGPLETPPHPHPDENFASIAGYVAAILWDMVDPGNENHDGNSSHDRLNIGFEVIWDVLTNFDPDPADPAHNHPRTLDELFNGIVAKYPMIANRVSEIYHENHITNKPAADLRVRVVGNPPSSIARGASFTATNTTENIGALTTGLPSFTRYFLSLDQTITAQDIALDTQAVPTLDPGGSWNGSITVMVPTTTPPATYFLGACADAPGAIFESNEGNNCLAATSPVVVQASCPAPTLSVSSSNPLRGSMVTVTWSGICSPTSTDWIGLYVETSADMGGEIDWVYVSCSQTAGGPLASGWCTYRIPSDGSVMPGRHNFRLFSNNGYTRLAISGVVTVR